MVRRKKKRNRFKAEEKPSAFLRSMAAILQVMVGIAVIIGMSLIFVFSHDWVTQCDYFRTKKVIVTGTERLEPGDIRKIANVWDEINILSVNLVNVRKRLLAVPWIADAEIRRVLPSTLIIHVTEHRPMAILDLGKSFLINSEGEIFKETENLLFENLPVITGAEYLDWKVEDRPGTRIYAAVMELLRLGQDENCILSDGRIDEIIIDREIGLSLKTDTGVPVITMGFGDYEVKCRNLARIVAHMDRVEGDWKFDSIDLRNPDRIVARPVYENSAVAKKGGLT